MENLAVSTPSLPQNASVQASDSASPGAPIDSSLVTGKAGQSFAELLAKQVTLLLPQDEKPAKLSLKEAGRQASSVDEQSPVSASLGLPVQPAAVDPALLGGSPVPLAFMDPAMMPKSVLPQAFPGENEKLQRPVAEILSPQSSAANGKVLPMSDAKTPDIAALAGAQTPEHPKALPSGGLQGAGSSGEQISGQQFSEVLAERKINTFPQESAQPQAVALGIQPQSAVAPTTGNASAIQPEMAIAQKVGSESWGSGLGDKVIWVVGNQTRGAEIHLNPPALGPLEIHVDVVDGQANVSFMTQHASVREAIDAATPRLREMLGDVGISMGSVSVNVGSFAQQQQLPSREPHQGATAWTPESGGGVDAFGIEIVSSISQPLHGRGMVDLFA